MKKRVFSLALALVMALALVPEAALAAEEPARRGVLTYTQAIAPQYEEAQTFSEGLAAVKLNGKWGYINESGETVIPFRYDVAYVFQEGYAVVGTVKDACYLGFIDKKGNYKPFTHEDHDNENAVKEMTWDLSVLETDDPWAYIFHNGYVSIRNESDPYIPRRESWSDVFDATGRWVAQGHRNAYPINEGIMIGGDEYYNYKWYVNMATGETFAPGGAINTSSYGGHRYYDLRPFNQGLAPVRVGTVEDTEWNWTGWGFIDKAGNWVIEPTDHGDMWIQDPETDYEIFGETGVALLGDEDGHWGGIDKTGKTVIPFQYDGLQAASEGLMGFEENGKWGFLDAGTLEVAIPAQFDQVTRFNNGCAAAASEGGDGTMTAYLIDRKGNPIPGGDKLDRGTYFRESNNYGNLVIDPGEYVVIRENGKYGYGHIDYLPALPEPGDMSGWAYEEVTDAIENNLVPVELQNLYGRDITRGEFCQMAVAIIETFCDKDIDDVVAATTGKDLDEHLHTYPFGDTASRNVLACYALGIVAGRGDGDFDPYVSITRQEAATMLGRLADSLGVAGGKGVNFIDAGSFPTWASQSIAKVSGLIDPISGKAVMGGTGGGGFSPLQTYTREQAYTTALRLYHAAQGPGVVYSAQVPGATGAEYILPVDSINVSTVLTLEDAVYYEFGDHGYMSLGLDGTELPYDVYYGIKVTVDGSRLNLTWHNYTGAAVTPTTVTMYSPYLDSGALLGKLDVAEGGVCAIDAAPVKTGPYELQVAWSNGFVTSVGFYKNGDDLYACQAAEETGDYICKWYDRKNAIDRLLASSGVTPENSLDYSDDYWAYPVPTNYYGDGYRCDNSRWIGLARSLTTWDMPDAQKAVVIHDWMVANLAYDQYKVDDLGTTRAAAHKDYTGKYSMWDLKIGVCSDFTTVYCIMLRSLGIPAVSLDYDDNHVWNVVYLDGDWVEIDMTDDIDRIVYGEDVTDITNANDTVDYDTFGTPYTIETIVPGVHNINYGVYTRKFVTGNGY